MGYDNKIKIIRLENTHKHFIELTRQLDEELHKRYGNKQTVYDEHNKIDIITTSILGYYEEQPVTCGCFKQLDKETIEIKRMFVKNEFRRKGFSVLILKELEKWGNELGYLYSKLETGKGAGKGYNLNIPMSAGKSEDDYITAFENVVTPALNKFKPEVVLISAGFDAHKADPLSSIHLSTGTFGVFTEILLAVADKHAKSRVICFLEGGYNLNALANSVDLVIQTLVEHEV